MIITKLIKSVITLVILAAIVGGVGVVMYHDGVILRGAISIHDYSEYNARPPGTTILVKAEVDYVLLDDSGDFSLVYGERGKGQYSPLLGVIPSTDSVPGEGVVILAEIIFTEEYLTLYYQGASRDINNRITSWTRCWIQRYIPPVL